METIGFVGLGHMGLPMARNLQKAGYRVIGYDLSEEALAQFCAQGGERAEGIQDLAQHCEVLITMLQSGAQVRAVTEECYAVLAKGALHLDCSTIDVDSARAVQKMAIEQEIACLDAPVSGGVAGAEAASLTFMMGGEETVVERARPILQKMGKTLIHAGAAGSGQAAKICNNMILGISMIAVSEAFVLAERLGLEAKKLHEVVSAASGQCWTMDKYDPVPNVLENVPANHDYAPGFASAMMLKDLRLSQQCAESVDTPLRMATQATALYQAHVDQGQAEKDFSSIITFVSEGEG